MLKSLEWLLTGFVHMHTYKQIPKANVGPVLMFPC
jgi:hypothetical protein